MRVAEIAGMLALTVLAAQAQPPAFEVASVRLSPPRPGAAGFTRMDSDPALVRYSNTTLQILISMAYKVDSRLVVGGPAWLDSEHYDVVAKLPSDTPKEQVPAMMQRLLEERFKLAIHRETKEERVYALVVAKTGPKLEKGREGPNQMLPGRIMGGSITMGMLAGMLASFVGGEVVDRTGLPGTYHVDLKWQPPADPANTSELFAALQEQLGLKVESGKAPVERLVVDRAERIPAEN